MKREYEKGFKIPLKINKIGSHIWDSNGEMAERSIIINSINDNPYSNFINVPVKITDGIVYDCNGRPIIMIRGWGHLTGIGGLNLSDNEAALIQDDFGDYIVEKLNK